jgi:VWFA-related protein
MPGAAVRVALALSVIALTPTLVDTARQAVFRSTVDLIAVDVQVVDADGNPIGQIGPEAFQVSINGQRRKVVSAQFIRHADGTPTAERAPSPAPVPQSAAPVGPGRTVILAVDNGSFETGATRGPVEAARRFLQHLDPDDRVGLYVYPTVSWIAPSTQRAAIGVRLSNLTGEKEAIHTSFNLTVHEIVDITSEGQSPFAFFLTRNVDPETSLELSPVLKIARRECPGESDCAARIYSEGRAAATQLERGAELSLRGLDTLLRILAEIPGRKAVVLVTGGLLVSDRLDGRPDVGNVAKLMGQTAARANATIYTVHVDQTFYNSNSASRKGTDGVDLARDRAMLGNWLEDFSRSAGGKRINVPPGGTVDFALDRVLRETSAYYLLGVEPAAADRDGLPRELKVKVDRRGVTVRNRQWVLVPARGRQ